MASEKTPRTSTSPESTDRALERVDDRTRRSFRSLDAAGEGRIARTTFEAALRARGLELSDPRLASTMAALDALESGARLGPEDLATVVGPNAPLVERALQGDLALPEFEAFGARVAELFEAARANTAGHVADYIPQLATVPPERFGLSLCSVDGQRFDVGDAREDFCVQSCCKPLNYCLALEEHGVECVHAHVGCEPSGQRFNELTLDDEGRPHNPLINAGGILACALIRPDASAAERFDHVQRMWRRACGGQKPGFSNPTYLSERKTADRNYALGYFMRESGSFPASADLIATLEFYFQCCSLESTTRSMSVLAATLAAGGLCPVTGERVLQPETVRRCLSLMDSCGMYDFSGQWAFTVGLPAKSGVSGAILIVVPNLLGLCVWSPRLDEHGNSVRGIDFARRLTETFRLHPYDVLAGGQRGDPRRTAP